MPVISIEELKHIAKLARLEFSDAELLKFAEEFNSILNYISEIKECDTAGNIAEHNLENYSGDVLREDTVIIDTLPKEIIAVAGEDRTKDNYVKTSKIVSKE